VLLLGLLVLFAVPAAASAGADTAHATVYTATNNPAGNAVIVFDSNKDGSLTQRAVVPTGGTGLASNPPFSFPIVDSSGSINVAQSGHVVFVVNAGDNTISSFRATPSGLELAAHVSSGGILPVSLTSHGNVLYVVNEVSSNIYGFRFSPSGDLQPLAGQAAGGQPLSVPFPGTVTAQIGFSPNGRQLVVTERGLPNPTGVIDTFNISGNGLAGPAQPNTGVGLVQPNPFGFDFDAAGHLLVSNAGLVLAPGNGPPPIPQVFDPNQFVGSATSYNVSGSGSITSTGDVLSGGRAACWLVVSKDGRYAFVTNTLSDTVPNIFSGIGGVTSYAVAPDGTMTYLGQVNTSPGNPGDEAVSQDGKYLYVLVPTVFPPDGFSHIETYRIGKDGSLTQVASAGGLGATISGLAAG
jgi:6-phosphogluconolactonase (cycloisomerase 2 family)